MYALIKDILMWQKETCIDSPMYDSRAGLFLQAVQLSVCLKEGTSCHHLRLQ